jgi:hypothetical protein
VAQVDTSQEAVAREEDEGENSVTTVENFSAVSLQEAVVQEENNCGHLAQAQVTIDGTQVDMSSETVASEDDEGENAVAVSTAECLVAVSLQEAVTQEAERKNDCAHFT